MAIYLKKFETQAAYEAAQSGLILPNVSLTVDNNVVHYNPSSPVPPTPSHDYVEIGGIKWATMNIGANSVTDYGLYFAWGDTQGYTAAQVGIDKQFVWSDYKYTNDGGTTMTKYNSSDGKTVLDVSDDAVTAAWGGNWRMPTTDEYAALGEVITTAWTSSYEGSGVAGIICTDNTDSSKVLFFPAVGFCENGIANGIGEWGDYWSSSINDGSVLYAYRMGFDDYDTMWMFDIGERYKGYAIRGVLGE